MAKFVVVPEDRIRALREATKALSEIQMQFKSLSHALHTLESSIESGGRIELDPSLFGVSRWAEPVEDEERRPGRLYKIGRAKGEYTYADVAYREVDEDRFTIGHAWAVVEPLIVTKSGRARDSFRRSIDTDERFERIGKRNGEIAYRKVPPEQGEIHVGNK